MMHFRVSHAVFQFVLFLALQVSGGCGGDPARIAWFDQFKQIHRTATGPAEEAAAYGLLVATAVVPVDGCQAAAAAAAAWCKVSLDSCLPRWRELSGDSRCSSWHAEALSWQMAGALEQMEQTRALTLLRELCTHHSQTYWASRGIEQFHEWARTELSEQQLSVLMVGLYEQYKETPVAGHLLFHAAGSDLGETPKAVLTPSVWRGLYHLQLLIEYHSSSPLWDDAVWMAAEQLAALGQSGDEARLLERALLPQPGRGNDTLAGAFCGKVRLRLAGLYERQGRYEDALYQLGLVINIHPDASLKDDALWQLASIHATCGEFDLQHEALTLLVAHCPWSRHHKAAREQLKITDQ